MIKLGIAAAMAAMTVAGCSSSAVKVQKSSPTNHPPSTAAYTPGPSDDAAIIASHIPGCSTVAANSVGKGGPAMTSAASCTLQGHVVIIDVFDSPANAAITDSLVDHQIYFAHSGSWVAFIAEQGATPQTSTLQMQLTDDAAGLMQQGFNSDGPVPTAPATQRQLVTTIAKSLGGAVGSAR